MNLPQSRLSRLTLASLATLLGSFQLAYAAPVLGANSSAAVLSGPAVASTYSDAFYVNSGSYISDSDGTASGYAFANSAGAYAVSSSVYGKGSSAAHSQFAMRFENLSGVAQHYTLSFHIYGGHISTQNYYRELVAGETMSVNYGASVKTQLNGLGGWTSVFNSSATLTRDENGSMLSRSGVALSGTDADVSDHSYAWSNDYYTVNLGIVAAGGFVDVLAEVDNSAVADVGIYSFGGDCNGYGEGYGYGGCYGTSFVGQASSFYGDPLELTTADPLAFALTANAVAQDLPEPNDAALVGLALGAAGLASRRRRQS